MTEGPGASMALFLKVSESYIKINAHVTWGKGEEASLCPEMSSCILAHSILGDTQGFGSDDSGRTVEKIPFPPLTPQGSCPVWQEALGDYLLGLVATCSWLCSPDLEAEPFSRVILPVTYRAFRTCLMKWQKNALIS